VDLAGKRIPQSPKIKTTLAVYYDMDLNGHGTLSPSLTWVHSGSYYTTDYNTALDYQKAYNTLDLSLRWTAPTGKYFVEGYGNNVTDVPVLYSAVVGRRERVQVSYGPPATYGVRFGVKF
jgi:iron complex outermembrane receptor protein